MESIFIHTCYIALQLMWCVISTNVALATLNYLMRVIAQIVQYTWKGALIVISGLVLNCVFFGALFRPLEQYVPPR